jgi:hypothetical protein
LVPIVIKFWVAQDLNKKEAMRIQALPFAISVDF